MSKPFRLRVVSDLHVGSKYAIWPPDCREYAPTEASQWLWDRAVDLTRALPSPDLTVVNGDVVHGRNRKSDHADIYAVDVANEINPIAGRVVELFVGTQPWYMVTGTPYHDVECYAYVADTLGAKEWPSGKRFGQILSLDVRGTGVNIAHHPDGGTVLYKGTSLDRMSLWSIIGSSLKKVPNASVIIRSHNHFFAEFRANGRLVVQTPCWTFPDAYAKKSAYFRYTSDLGVVDVLFEKDAPPAVEAHLIEQVVPEPVAIR